MNLEKTVKNLRLRGFEVSYFDNRDDAKNYLLGKIKDATVGIGGMMTCEEIGLFDALVENGNTVYWHWKQAGWETLENENASDVFISSANAIAETGEIVNIDGRGNRLAGLAFGKKRVFIVAGTNKIAEDLTAAIERARNVAAVKNAARFKKDTPCQKDGKCHDCRVADRICREMLITMGVPMDMESIEVVLIGEELGY